MVTVWYYHVTAVFQRSHYLCGSSLFEAMECGPCVSCGDSLPMAWFCEVCYPGAFDRQPFCEGCWRRRHSRCGQTGSASSSQDEFETVGDHSASCHHQEDPNNQEPANESSNQAHILQRFLQPVEHHHEQQQAEAIIQLIASMGIVVDGDRTFVSRLGQHIRAAGDPVVEACKLWELCCALERQGYLFCL
jgi:hypothetical protein